MLKAELIGNLGHDASVRQINGRDYVCLDVAHGEKVNGERKTVWISVLWLGNGGGLLQYLRKGATVFVRGDISAKIYTNRDGQTSVSMSVMARELQICQFAEQGRQSAQPQTSAPPAQQAVAQTSSMTTAGEDDDLPF